MTNSANAPSRKRPDVVREPQLERYQRIRTTATDLAAPLSPEDMMVQSMPDASPTRWHLAHTTWFFEQFLLLPYVSGYKRFTEGWEYLFNSYYYSVGDMFQRSARGMISRPSVSEILDYRAHVDDLMSRLIADRTDDPDFNFRLNLGLNHEQQHQELILTDIKHALSLNPLRPAYRTDVHLPATTRTPLRYVEAKGGLVKIGANENSFCFDNETPAHEEFLPDFQIGSRLVSNAEYREFIEDGGYSRSELWLSDGWAAVQSRQWRRPIYWEADLASELSLLGPMELDPHRAVSHVSYYEADAYARWAGARLPSEAEWEHIASEMPVCGNLLDNQMFHPCAAMPDAAISQLFGDTWEWTRSAYGAYPGFQPLDGSLGEYNGKFMCSQMVLRGGSCVTPADHIRASYRNFFYPDTRWQFTGIRLARDTPA